MPVALAFIAVVAIWSTTPLAVQWSTASLSPMASLALRMGSAAVLCLLWMRLASIPLKFSRKAQLSYLAGGIAAFGAMALVYWGAQSIPSGLIAVIFGISPVLAGILATWLLNEQAFTPAKVLALMSGMFGLWLVFRGELAIGGANPWGLAAIAGSAFLFALSGVVVKRVDAPVHPLAQATGTMLVATVGFVLCWLATGMPLPAAFPDIRELAALSYLSIVGSVLGFVLFFWLLARLTASQVSLVPMLTPGFALLLGNWLAGEQVSVEALAGAAVILSGLVVYQWGDNGLRRWYLWLDGHALPAVAEPVAIETVAAEGSGNTRDSDRV